MQIVLASSSPYRKKLLTRLGIEFECVSPDIDETPHLNELPEAMAARLAREKASAVANAFNYALIIASDQVATFAGEIIGKPGSEAKARQQLARFRGKAVTFLTSLCVLNQSTGRLQEVVIPFEVTFRQLSDAQIADYVQRDLPLDCAGSFKWESLGIALFERMEGPDVTALEGLPLLSLVTLLEKEGINVLAQS